MPPHQPSPVDLLLVHSSDLHVDDEANATKHGDGTAGLAAVLAAARAASADIVLLAGDTFDNNRVPAPVLDRTGRLLADAGIPVVILPGNHDPALPNSVFVRGGLAAIPNVTIIGITHDEAVGFPHHDLEIWGHAHRDYENMAPSARPARPQHALADRHGARPLRAAAQPRHAAAPVLAVQRRCDRRDRGGLSGARPLGPAPSASATARCRPTTPARPISRGTVNLIRLTAAGEVVVKREPLRWDDAP